MYYAFSGCFNVSLFIKLILYFILKNKIPKKYHKIFLPLILFLGCDGWIRVWDLESICNAKASDSDSDKAIFHLDPMNEVEVEGLLFVYILFVYILFVYIYQLFVYFLCMYY